MRLTAPTKWKLNVLSEILIRVAFGIIYIVLELTVSPFKRIIQPADWPSYQFPHKPDTVEVWWLGVLAIVVPTIAIVAAVVQSNVYFTQKKISGKRRSFLLWDIYDVFMAYTLAVVLCGVLTSVVKLLYGRPRPDFFIRCFPTQDLNNQNEIANKIASISTTDLICENTDEKEVEEGRKSFPSGHSSIAFVSFAFVAFYIWGKCLAFARYGKRRSWRFATGWPFIIFATYVCLSRTQDYRHHWTDVLGGGLLGLFTAYICYRLYYPDLRSCSANLSYSQINWLLGLSSSDLGSVSLKKLNHLRCEMSPYENKSRGKEGSTGGGQAYKSRIADGNNNVTVDDKTEYVG